MSDSPWLDVRRAAARALVSPSTILRAARTGQLKGYKIAAGRLWRFREADIDAFVMLNSTPQLVVPRRGRDPREVKNGPEGRRGKRPKGRRQ